MADNLQAYKRHFIFDISSGYVSGAVVYWDKQSPKPTIEFSHKQEIEVLQADSLTELRKNTALAIDKVCQEMTNFVNLSLGEFFIESGSVFLSSPWITFENYTLKDERIKSWTIDEPYLESLVQKNLEEEKAKNKKVLINSQMINVQANGYETSLYSLLGQKVSRVEVAVLDTRMDAFDQEFITKSINNHFSFLQLRFNSYLPVLFNQIKYLYDLEDDFIFLDMTGAVTDFGVFGNSQIKNLSSLPVGKNHILQACIKQGLASDMRIANSILIMYLRGELEEKIRKKLQKIIEDFGNTFRQEVKKILDKFQSYQAPLNVFVLAHRETRWLLSELDIFSPQQTLSFIDEKIIRNFVESTDEYFDPFLALEAEYIFDNK